MAINLARSGLGHDPEPASGERFRVGAAVVGRLTAWLRDLGLGLRFAVSGREARVRTVLTGLGAGLAVAMLLFAAAIPGVIHARAARSASRTLVYYGASLPPAAASNTELADESFTSYRGADIRGLFVKPEGPRAPVPFELSAIPGPGDMDVSPALGRLLASPQGALLRPRLPYRIVGTMGEAGLDGPQDLAFVAGDSSLKVDQFFVNRIDSIGQPAGPQPTSPLLTMLSVLGFVLLLVPVAVFIAAAVRFGGERRDLRLAALRLLGADIRTTHRVAAGEALAGALLGSLVGLGLFALGRQLAGLVDISGFSVFPSDIAPGVTMAVLILLATPVAAIAVTSFALRNVSVEPLGVARRSAGARRRLWWRLLTPVVGLLLLAPSVESGVSVTTDETMLAAGAALILLGLALLLPWGLDRVVSRLGGGPLALHLGSRRLQLPGGGAARAVSGVTVAVAAAITARALFGGVGADMFPTDQTAWASAQAAVSVQISSPAEAGRLDSTLRAIKGVGQVTTVVTGIAIPSGPASVPVDDRSQLSITVAACAQLAQLVVVTDCRPGSIYRAEGSGSDLAAGVVLDMNQMGMDGSLSGAPKPWTIPATIRVAKDREGPDGSPSTGIYATPQALPITMLANPSADSTVQFEPGSGPDTIEYVRNAAASVDPLSNVSSPSDVVSLGPRTFQDIEHGVVIGSFATLLLVAFSLAIGTIEQLRERRKLLAVLVAFGTRRSTLALSVLWQSAVPIALGLALALASGLGLGTLLLTIVRAPIRFAWATIAELLLAGAAAVLLATLLSLPALWRMMRAEGLRTE